MQAASSDLEAIDVANGIQTGYDSDGRLLRLEAVRSRVRFLFWETWPFGSVHIEAAEVDPNHSDKLREVLETFLERVREPGPFADIPLHDLAGFAWKWAQRK